MMKNLWVVLLSLFLPVTSSSLETIHYQKEIDKKELFGAYYEQAEAKMEQMSLEQMVGQVFLARMDASTIEEEISSYQPGGYILFARDFESETKESLSARLKSYQERSSIPFVFAVDEEGGTVTRVSRYRNFRSSKFPSNQELYRQGGFSLIERIEREKIALLKSLGIHLNLAPVADLSTSSADYIYKRSLGQDVATTSEYIKRVVKIDYENTFACCLKHFPGYGNNVDTHTGIAIDERAYEQFVSNDYLPFQAGISEHVPTVLVSHNIVKAIDPETPSSLSFKVHQELREKLQFSGLILTDDLVMDAISNYTHDENSAGLALLAGNDLIITSNLKEDYAAVLSAVKSGKISNKILHNAVRRVLAFKYQYQIA